jgi:hypothetical protein
VGGTEKAPTIKPELADELIAKCAEWVQQAHWDLLTDPTIPVVWLDEK